MQPNERLRGFDGRWAISGWRQVGNPRGAVFPDRCVICNKECDGAPTYFTFKREKSHYIERRTRVTMFNTHCRAARCWTIKTLRCTMPRVFIKWGTVIYIGIFPYRDKPVPFPARAQQLPLWCAQEKGPDGRPASDRGSIFPATHIAHTFICGVHPAGAPPRAGPDTTA